MNRPLCVSLLVFASATLAMTGCSSHGGNPPGGGGAGADGGVADGATSDRPVGTDGSGPGCTTDGGGVKKAMGQPCGCADECSSNFCVDGVCCKEACSGACQTCASTGSEGTCVARSNGREPRTAADCPVSAAGTCGLDGQCDGVGGCRKYLTGTVCKAGVCDGDAVTGEYVCDGAGHCRPGPTTICAPFSCDLGSNDCFAMCSATNQCVSGHVCDQEGSCGKRLRGAACTKNADCLSGFCADNICCNVACQGPCVSCGLPSLEGTCWPIEAGMPDPRAVCADQGAASCGMNGRCDGLGGCSRYPVDTPCAAPFCSGNRLNTTASCDGLGTCRMPGLQNCSPFLCKQVGQQGACTGTCDKDSDCDTGIACVNHTCGPKQNGQSCTKAAECKSGQCVDGVCCDSACTGGCRSCALPSAPGHCTLVAAGNADPRAVCQDKGAATCGTNGKCDGAGGCQLFAKATPCSGESCTANVYTPGSTCDGAGRCVTPPSLACSPYSCNGNQCFMACTADAQCLTPNRCNMNSCGLANNGASCSVASQCKSGFCAQGVCCDKACTGACASCALTGSLGTCTNVATGSADPAGICKDTGAAGCGSNGKCQAGGCQNYPSGTSCAGATCAAGSASFMAGSTCDGAGVCVKPAARSCFPYVCGTDACKAACTTNADCAAPALCTNGSCGLKDPGRACADGSECRSGFCRQGVCCATECNGTCKSCNASASTAGSCTNVTAGGADPAGTCKDMGAGTCGTTGVCDGAGACDRYAAGTVCVASSCPAGASTQANARTCDGAGSCRAATTTPCTPYVCNGTDACNSACRGDADCLAPTICDPMTNHCGNKSRQGQLCTAPADCLTGLSCVDGICCASASCAMCQACNVGGSLGTCTSVPSGGAEPHGRCPINASSVCGNIGTCDGTGHCDLAPTTVTCAAQTCSVSTYTPARHCDGNGNCGTASPFSCAPYTCGTGMCKSSCATDGDCVAPDTCQGGNCALKAPGIACTAGNQCQTGNCIDGVCCGSASCVACNACNVSGHAGGCFQLAAGTADTRCMAVAGAACGVTNVCDGNGACGNSTAMCAAASCSGSSFTPASFCSGMTTSCPTTAPMSCGTYKCTATGCRSTCAGDGDCADGAYCDGSGHCVSKGGIGDGCIADTQCGMGRCVDGVCCNIASATCPLCQVCNLAASKGTCSFVGTGVAEPHNLCTASGICGNTGACAANQTCAQAATSTMCGSASCSAGTETQATFCNGAGSCSTPVVRACDPYVCGATACKGSCASEADCIAGHYCDGQGACQPKLNPGVACTSTNQCASGVCGAQSVCCDSPCDGMCMTCMNGTSPGMCMQVSNCPPPPP